MEYVPEPDMACRVLPPPETAEEELARAPEWILVESTDSRQGCSCGLRKTRPLCGRLARFPNAFPGFPFSEKSHHTFAWHFGAQLMGVAALPSLPEII